MDVIEIITPYYPRGSVTDALLNGFQFTLTQAIQVARAALRGLRELHEVHRILHRDVKSGNILLADGPPYALVADLGMAGRMDEKGNVPALENPTLYSPPELVELGTLSVESDLYAFGLVLRELIGGAFPYHEYPRSDVIEKLMNLKNPIYPRDRTLPIWAPRDIRRVYKKATARSPAARYHRARDMDEDLANARIADWRQVAEYCWEAPLVHTIGLVAVEAVWRPRAGSYQMSVKRKRAGRWMRCQADSVVTDLESADAQRVFDQATNIACAR